MDFDDQALALSVESGNPFAIAGASALKGFKSIINEFGRGRREADVIVPVQNRMWSVIKAADDEAPMAGMERLVQLRDLVYQTWDDFEKWVRSQTWSDGRAAQQALDRSKDPWLSVDRVKHNIQARIDQSGTSANMPAIGNPNTMVWIGGGLLAAKLLGFL